MVYSFVFNFSSLIKFPLRCSTDILLGKNCGLKTLLVLTGVNSWKEVEAWGKSDNPEDRRMVSDYYLPSLGHMAPLLGL